MAAIGLTRVEALTTRSTVMTLDDLEQWLTAVASTESNTVEKLIEHIFLAELLQECWFCRRQLVEVLRSEVDAAGYDLILESGGVIRHVQVKASRRGARTSKQTVNARLEQRSGGCIIWIFYSVNPATSRAELSYRWREATSLPATRGRHSRGRGPRENTRVIRKGDFEEVPTISALVDRLFGDGAARS